MHLQVLFLGNSHTYFNYMPQMLAHLVASEDRGFELSVDQCTGEGAGLAWHWQNPQSLEAIKQNQWDFVVLQDRSGGPLEEPESFARHAGLLDAAIKEKGAHTILFLTWANQSRPETQKLISNLYQNTARNLKAHLAPVGSAWDAILKLNQNLVLHHRDGRHANPMGSYLAACVFYSVLFDKSPEGLPGSFFHKGKQWLDLDKDTAALLQRTAWETVSMIKDLSQKKH
jgi:hypothetical protein